MRVFSIYVLLVATDPPLLWSGKAALTEKEIMWHCRKHFYVQAILNVLMCSFNLYFEEMEYNNENKLIGKWGVSKQIIFKAL